MMYTKERVRQIYLKNIKEELAERGWSHRRFADELGINKNTSDSLLRNGTLTHEMVANVCNAFDLDPWVLFTEEREHDKKT